MASNTKNNSRFSTLKVFKFAGSKGEGSSRPPVPPPKDHPYYLNNNHSFASLSPDSPLSLPATPLSADYTRRPSPAPSQSVVSLRSLLSPSAPTSSTEGDPYLTEPVIASSASSIISSVSQKRALFKFSSLGKRIPKPSQQKAVNGEYVPQEPADDDGISKPWNFQHNIHVDEGYIGLPPSWSSALSEAGFSNEEITAIHSRRNVARQSTAQYFTDRPHSPALLSRPLPRTTSLPRSSTNGSASSSPVLTHGSTLGVQSVSSTGSHFPDGSNSDAQYVFINDHLQPSNTLDTNHHAPEMPPVTPSVSEHSVGRTIPTISQPRPRTPPRRIWHVTNDASPDQNSPPPAYRSIIHSNNSTYSQEKQSAQRPAEPSTSHTPPEDIGNEDADPEGDMAGAEDEGEDEGGSDEGDLPELPRHVINKRLNRLTVLPPRLSFHQDGDLSDWAGSMLSALTPTTLSPPAPTPSSSKSCPSVFGVSSSLEAATSSFPNTPPTATPTLSTSQACPPLFGVASSLEADTSSASNSLLTGTTPTPSPRRHPPQRPIPVLPDISFGVTIPTGDDLIALTEAEGKSPYPDDSEMIPMSALSDDSPIIPSSPFELRLTEPSAVNQKEDLSDSEQDDDDTMLTPGERDPNRDSGMSTDTVTSATIVKDAAIVRRAAANVIDRASFIVTNDGDDEEGQLVRLKQNDEISQAPASPSNITPRQSTRFYKTQSIIAPPSPMRGSPHSSYFSSESGSTNLESLAGSSSSSCQDAPLSTPKPLFGKGLPPPSPLQKNFGPDMSLLISTTDTFGGVVRDEYDDEENTRSVQGHSVTPAVEIKQVVPKEGGEAKQQGQMPIPSSPISYEQPYPPWISESIAPLREFMTPIDPRRLFADLQEVAEGESGSVYAVRVLKHEAAGVPMSTSHLAIKKIAIPPAGAPKLKDLKREMKIMNGVKYEHILSMDALYIDLVDDSLWIRMELMERSLADVVGLVNEGLCLQERMIARFASDVLLALEYLQKQHIAHRDVRSDNLLLNSNGVVKIADFSNAVRLARDAPMCFDPVGVIYWQAPEMRAGAYNAMKVDVWSLGATVWELAETEPPFAEVQDARQVGDQWPPLSQPTLFGRHFNDFLRLCSRPSSSRPNPTELLNTHFIRNACGRAVNVQLLSQCRAIEEHIMQRENNNS